MEHDPFTTQGKKLLFIALFLLGVALLVGGEDTPGMIGQMGETERRLAGPVASPASRDRIESRPEPRAVAYGSDAGAADPELDSWYADAGPIAPSEPEPVDESHLIQSTEPLVDVEPGS